MAQTAKAGDTGRDSTGIRKAAAQFGGRPRPAPDSHPCTPRPSAAARQGVATSRWSGARSSTTSSAPTSRSCASVASCRSVVVTSQGQRSRRTRSSPTTTRRDLPHSEPARPTRAARAGKRVWKRVAASEPGLGRFGADGGLHATCHFDGSRRHSIGRSRPRQPGLAASRAAGGIENTNYFADTDRRPLSSSRCSSASRPLSSCRSICA